MYQAKQFEKACEEKNYQEYKRLKQISVNSGECGDDLITFPDGSKYISREILGSRLGSYTTYTVSPDACPD